jgi:catechol 2,3-dioxygenase-like lactoylglutathione lyase family enzyme
MSMASLEGISLHVADLERSAAFYSRIPGAKMVAHRPCRYTVFCIGHIQLTLVAVTGRMPFRMEVETDDLELLYEELCRAGIKPESRPKVRPWGETCFRVLDPDGNIMEFGLTEAPNAH